MTKAAIAKAEKVIAQAEAKSKANGSSTPVEGGAATEQEKKEESAPAVEEEKSAEA